MQEFIVDTSSFIAATSDDMPSILLTFSRILSSLTQNAFVKHDDKRVGQMI